MVKWGICRATMDLSVQHRDVSHIVTPISQWSIVLFMDSSGHSPLYPILNDYLIYTIHSHYWAPMNRFLNTALPSPKSFSMGS